MSGVETIRQPNFTGRYAFVLFVDSIFQRGNKLCPGVFRFNVHLAKYDVILKCVGGRMFKIRFRLDGKEGKGVGIFERSLQFGGQLRQRLRRGVGFCGQ